MMLQNDKKWKDIKLGTSSDTIGRSGCLLTCYAMIATDCGKAQTPPMMNQCFINANCYTNGALLSSDSLEKVFPDIKYIGNENYTGIKQIQDLTNGGKFVIIEVDYDSNPSNGKQTHFILARWSDGKNIFCDDPLFGDVSLFDRYKAMSIIKLIKYDRNAPQTPQIEDKMTDKEFIKSIIELVNKFNK